MPALICLDIAIKAMEGVTFVLRLKMFRHVYPQKLIRCTTDYNTLVVSKRFRLISNLTLPVLQHTPLNST